MNGFPLVGQRRDGVTGRGIAGRGGVDKAVSLPLPVHKAPRDGAVPSHKVGRESKLACWPSLCSHRSQPDRHTGTGLPRAAGVCDVDVQAGRGEGQIGYGAARHASHKSRRRPIPKAQ
ncbi:hypothetical protein VFPBJ_03804 [Purpureocillium lilacinum]|uniref:Uncharacterized protein n=1 Tax=Purpureocillium lilacinum TaxID=33203 RepID=A0A179H640_PURLI|nr:hypothetical protein VFPBJ_03804 [Purpureocillium lilacinum]